MRHLPALGLVLSLLSACGPITLQEAERQCFERARLAQHPAAKYRSAWDRAAGPQRASS